MIRTAAYRFSLGLLLCTALAACSLHASWQKQKDWMAGIQSTRRPVPPVGNYRDFPGVIHVHSSLSHDSRGSMDEIASAARETGTAFVIMTDHNNPRIPVQGFEGWFDGVLILRGSEIIKGCSGHSGDTCNSLLVLGVKDYLNHKTMTMDEIIRQVKARGGLAFAAHAGGFRNWDAPGLDGLEIYDILDDAVDHRWRFPKYFFDILYSFRRYPDQVFMSILDPPDQTLARWDALLQKRRWVGIAGNDAHQNIRVLGRQIDPYERSFRFVRTHILARKLGEKEILGALAAGHAFVAFDMLADASGFSFRAEGKELLGIQGDEVEFRPGLRLTVESPLAGKISLVRNGRVIRQVTALQWTEPIEEPGVYRVEVRLRLGREWKPWIYSNPIRVS